MSVIVETKPTSHPLSQGEMEQVTPALYGGVKNMLFANPTFLRQSAEATWDEAPRDPGGWINFTIPTKTEGELYEVYQHVGSQRVDVDRIELDAQGMRLVTDEISVSLGEISCAIPRFASRTGKSGSQEAFVGFEKFVETFKAEAI